MPPKKYYNTVKETKLAINRLENPFMTVSFMPPAAKGVTETAPRDIPIVVLSRQDVDFMTVILKLGKKQYAKCADILAKAVITLDNCLAIAPKETGTSLYENFWRSLKEQYFDQDFTSNQELFLYHTARFYMPPDTFPEGLSLTSFAFPPGTFQPTEMDTLGVFEEVMLKAKRPSNRYRLSEKDITDLALALGFTEDPDAMALRIFAIAFTYTVAEVVARDKAEVDYETFSREVRDIVTSYRSDLAKKLNPTSLVQLYTLSLNTIRGSAVASPATRDVTSTECFSRLFEQKSPDIDAMIAAATTHDPFAENSGFSRLLEVSQKKIAPASQTLILKAFLDRLTTKQWNGYPENEPILHALVQTEKTWLVSAFFEHARTQGVLLHLKVKDQFGQTVWQCCKGAAMKNHLEILAGDSSPQSKKVAAASAQQERELRAFETRLASFREDLDRTARAYADDAEAQTVTFGEVLQKQEDQHALLRKALENLNELLEAHPPEAQQAMQDRCGEADQILQRQAQMLQERKSVQDQLRPLILGCKLQLGPMQKNYGTAQTFFSQEEDIVRRQIENGDVRSKLVDTLQNIRTTHNLMQAKLAEISTSTVSASIPSFPAEGIQTDITTIAALLPEIEARLQAFDGYLSPALEVQAIIDQQFRHSQDRSRALETLTQGLQTLRSARPASRFDDELESLKETLRASRTEHDKMQEKSVEFKTSLEAHNQTYLTLMSKLPDLGKRAQELTLQLRVLKELGERILQLSEQLQSELMELEVEERRLKGVAAEMSESEQKYAGVLWILDFLVGLQKVSPSAQSKALQSNCSNMIKAFQGMEAPAANPGNVVLTVGAAALQKNPKTLLTGDPSNVHS